MLNILHSHFLEEPEVVLSGQEGPGALAHEPATSLQERVDLLTPCRQNRHIAHTHQNLIIIEQKMNNKRAYYVSMSKYQPYNRPTALNTDYTSNSEPLRDLLSRT